MKLLFDANLSPRLAQLLGDLFPGSKHVADLQLESASDNEIWNRAQREGLTIVTKDADFEAISLASSLTEPPKVVWIRRGNCSTSDIAAVLRTNKDAIDSLAGSESSVLILY